VPLIWPEGATRHDAKVRIWCGPGQMPALVDAAPGWRDRGSEIVPGRDSLPALVLAGTGPDLPLTLRIRDRESAPLAALACERTLVQVAVDEQGNQAYRVRFLVRKFSVRQLQLELPVAIRPNLHTVRMGPAKQEKTLTWTDPVWNIAAIQLPDEIGAWNGQSVVLEIEYSVPADSTENGRWGALTLTPPQFHADIAPGKVRWQVALSSDQVAMALGRGVQLDYRWAIQGWLATPEPSVTSGELEVWLTGHDAAENEPMTLSFWRQSPTPLRVVHLPREFWLLTCSAALVLLGLFVYMLPLSRGAVWLLVLALGIGIVAAALLWPAALPPLLFGCQPGIVVLALVLGVQWLLQERYRRQVVFLPGFARRKSGSSLQRAEQAKPREPSTIDVPEKAKQGSVT
jgi:hypothetical protein